MGAVQEQLECNVLISFMLALILAQAAPDNVAAVRAHMYCVRDNVVRLDSRRVSAKQLAKIIQPICHELHEIAMKNQEG
jgi:hypothetical protein